MQENRALRRFFTGGWRGKGKPERKTFVKNM